MAKHDAIPTDPAIADGRNLRAQRTANSVAEALLNLLEQGHLHPTLRDVADEAGVSERAVFRHFQGTESLFNAVADIQRARIAADVPDLVAADAPLTERIESYINRWCWVHEHVSPMRRAVNLREPFSTEIQRRRSVARKQRTRDFETLFETELAAISSQDRSDILHAVSATMGWSTWEHLRTHRNLSVTHARNLMARTLRTIISGNF